MWKIFNTIRQMAERIANIRLDNAGYFKKKEMRIDMRLILVAIFLILYTIFTIPMALVLWIIGKFDERKKADCCTGMCQGRL